MHIEENKPLAPFTTLGIGGPARWLVDAGSEDDVVEATGWAREQGLKLFVLGGGSNLLVSDAGFDGLVLRISLRGIEICEPEFLKSAGKRIYRAAAGEPWDHCVEQTIQEGCAGLECLAGIPGTVGGTPVQNVGAYGQEVASVIDCLRAFDLEERSFLDIPAAECGFAYRRSRFNSTDRGRFIVTRVDYRLTPGGEPTLRYPDLQRLFAAEIDAGRPPTLAAVAGAVRSIRKAKGMLLVEGDPDCRSAGSFFKNPVVPQAAADAIAHASGLPLPRFPAGSDSGGAKVKLSAAWLIEQAGFHKGHALGNAAVSTRHTLALTNLGNATATDILMLAGQIRTTVHARFGIDLEMEPVMVGF